LKQVCAHSTRWSREAVGVEGECPIPFPHIIACVQDNLLPPGCCRHHTSRRVASQSAIFFAQSHFILMEYMRVAWLQQPRKLRCNENQLHPARPCGAQHWLLEMRWAAVKQQHGRNLRECTNNSRDGSDDGLHQRCVHPPRLESEERDILRDGVVQFPLHPCRQQMRVAHNNLRQVLLNLGIVADKSCMRGLPSHLLPRCVLCWVLCVRLSALHRFRTSRHISGVTT
jgi:hypothetical protein